MCVTATQNAFESVTLLELSNLLGKKTAFKAQVLIALSAWQHVTVV